MTEALGRLERLDLLSAAFQIPVLGKLELACRRKPFDVELTFSNLSCVIETKVDSNESGGWDDTWQTERIVAEAQGFDYLKQEKCFLFITYGTSEYYTKPYKNGPASPHFRHLKLDDIVSLVKSALGLPLPNRNKYEEWLSAMRVEQEKRSQSIDMLKAFSIFRQQYLGIHHDVDFPNNRLTFCAPELAFPLFHGLAAFWNSEPALYSRFGRVAVYPVSRMSPPVHDSILNFWEMWHTGNPPVGKNLIGDQGTLYFEVNEDFNLNLKLDAAALPNSLRDEVWRRLTGVEWLQGIDGRCRQYRQSAFVLFEWDFGFLRSLQDYSTAAQNLSSILESATKALA